MALSQLWSRVGQVARLLPRHPAEVLDKIRGEWELRADRRHPPSRYDPVPWERVVADVSGSLDTPLAPWLSGPEFLEFEREMQGRIEALGAEAPFPLWFCTAPALARLAYAFCRARKPAVVLETGVGYGVTSSFILRALELNGHGHLHSVDLPPLWRGADEFVGRLVPLRLRGRWTLYRGASHRLLPRVAPSLGPLDLFIHDSLHSFRTMQAEFRTVTPLLARTSLVIADDIQGNSAFGEWVGEAAPSYSAVVMRKADRDDLFGVAVFTAAPGA